MYNGFSVDVKQFELAILAKSYSIGELAKKAGVHRATISNIRRGLLPSLSTIGKLATALELDTAACERIFFANDLRETQETEDEE